MKLTRLKHRIAFTITGELLAKIPLYGFEFLLASWLVMNQYAEWVALGLIYRCAPYAHLGALSYFNKRYPLLLGKGNTSAAANLKTHTNDVINLVILCSLLLSLLLWGLQVINTALFLVICSVLIMQMFTYCQAKLRNEGEFTGYTVGLILYACLQFIIAYGTVRRYGVLAGVLSTFFAYLCSVLYYIFFLKVPYSLLIPKVRTLKRIVQLGWAPFALTVSAFLIQISDRLALVALDHSEQLAFYGFFALFLQIGIVTINSLGKVLSPYLLHLNGQKRESESLKISLNTCFLILGLYGVLCTVLFAYGNEFIEAFFAKFSGSLIGVYNYSTIGVILSLTLAFYPQLLAANQEKMIIRLNLGYFVFSVLLVYGLARSFSGFVVFSLASLLLSMVYGVIFVILVERVVKTKIALIRFSLLFILIVSLLSNYLAFFR